MDKRFISEVHPPVPVVLIYASESGSQGFGVPVMTTSSERSSVMRSAKHPHHSALSSPKQPGPRSLPELVQITQTMNNQTILLLTPHSNKVMLPVSFVPDAGTTSSVVSITAGTQVSSKVTHTQAALVKAQEIVLPTDFTRMPGFRPRWHQHSKLKEEPAEISDHIMVRAQAYQPSARTKRASPTCLKSTWEKANKL